MLKHTLRRLALGEEAEVELGVAEVRHGPPRDGGSPSGMFVRRMGRVAPGGSKRSTLDPESLVLGTGVPTVFVRRGLRPSGVAPDETITRFTWTLGAHAPEAGARS